MENQMTVIEALRITVNNLGGVAVPRALNQQIGIPIDQAISNILACIEALERAEQENKEKEQTETPGTSELHIVPDGEEAEDGNADDE